VQESEDTANHRVSDTRGIKLPSIAVCYLFPDGEATPRHIYEVSLDVLYFAATTGIQANQYG